MPQKINNIKKKYRETHREQLRVAGRKYRQSQRVKDLRKVYAKNRKEKYPLYDKEYYQKHKARHKLIGKLYYESHRKEINNYKRLWHQTPKGKLCDKRWVRSSKGRFYKKTMEHSRRLKEKGLTVAIIQQVYEDNIKFYGTLTCIYCLKTTEFGKDTLEHKLPLSRGGTNLKENLGIACKHCNFIKHNKTEKEFRGLLTK